MTRMLSGPLKGTTETYEGFRFGTLDGELLNTGIQLVTEDFNTFQVLVQADPSNGANVVVGDSGTRAIVLTPGSGITIPIGRASFIYVEFLGAGDSVHWMAMV